MEALICSCSNKIPWAYEKKKKVLFFTLLEAGKSKMKALADSVYSDGLLPGSWTLVFLLGAGPRELSQPSFIRALIPFMRAPPS